MAPFIEVLTRCYKRPMLLANNITSLKAQIGGDWIQTLLVDDEGRGIGWASENMGRYAGKLAGQYIWVLDDDDVCTRPTLFNELQAIANRHDPDVIMMRMDHGPRGVLPDAAHWERPPAHGYVGVSAFVVRRSVWQAQAWAWSPGVYHSDFNFIKAVFESDPRVFWYDVVASRVQQIGLGYPEKG